MGFQGFDKELAEFPAMYGSPDGALLFADIGPKFYTSLGFMALPDALQPKAGTTLMYRGPMPAIFKAPSYF